MFKHIKGIIWDWNGTLLDDTRLAVETMNQLLARRNLPELSINQYKEVFTFPVKDYYQKIGFDFEHEPFKVPALEFIARYNERLNDCHLQPDSVSILNHFKFSGLRQFILSAMKQDTLDHCLIHYQINHFFEQVSGLDDHYAVSKTENGQRLIAGLNMDSSQLILIGDTVHDFEVATELGCQCVLVANGHQAKTVLQQTGALVIDQLSQLLIYPNFRIKVTRNGTRMVRITPLNTEIILHSFPEYRVITGNVVSMDVAPPEAIPASFPKY